MKEKEYGAPAASAVLDMLEFMSSVSGALGPTDIARELGLSANLTFRILNVLSRKGYVIKNQSGQYELTAALFSLGMQLQNRFDLRTQARPFMTALAADIMESVQLQIPDGDMMLQLDFVAPPTPYYIVVTPGTRVYWHCNAFGKAVLAFSEDKIREKIMALPRPELTAKTNTSGKLLLKELTQIKDSYSSSEFEEYLQGIYCIASPVFDCGKKVVAAVGISGMTSRLDRERLPELQKKILECAVSISHAIGCKGGFE